MNIYFFRDAVRARKRRRRITLPPTQLLTYLNSVMQVDSANTFCLHARAHLNQRRHIVDLSAGHRSPKGQAKGPRSGTVRPRANVLPTYRQYGGLSKRKDMTAQYAQMHFYNTAQLTCMLTVFPCASLKFFSLHASSPYSVTRWADMVT